MAAILMLIAAGYDAVHQFASVKTFVCIALASISAVIAICFHGEGGLIHRNWGFARFTIYSIGTLVLCGGTYAVSTADNQHWLLTMEYAVMPQLVACYWLSHDARDEAKKR